jgi:hypothetical protein
MNLNRLKHRAALTLSLVAGLSPVASAQPAPAPKDESVQLDKYVVTGSMIKRVEGEGALPVVDHQAATKWSTAASPRSSRC